MCLIVYSNDHAPLTVRLIYSSSKLRTVQMMIFSLVAMIGLAKCCITSACLQWLCHSGERIVARGPLVSFCPAKTFRPSDKCPVHLSKENNILTTNMLSVLQILICPAKDYSLSVSCPASVEKILRRLVTMARHIPGLRLKMTPIIKENVSYFCSPVCIFWVCCLVKLTYKPMTTDCFVFIYNPLFIFHVSKVSRWKKKNHILLSSIVVYLRRIDITNASNNLPLLKILRGVWCHY